MYYFQSIQYASLISLKLLEKCFLLIEDARLPPLFSSHELVCGGPLPPWFLIAKSPWLPAMISHLQSQNSSSLALLHLNLVFPGPRPRLEGLRSLTGWKGDTYCASACMHVCIHAAIILWGAEQDPGTSTFHGVVGAMGEREGSRGGPEEYA